MEFDLLEFLRRGKNQGSWVNSLKTDPDTDRIDLDTDPRTDRIDLDIDQKTDRNVLGTDRNIDRVDLDTYPRTDRIDLDTGLDIDRTGKNKWNKPFSKTSISKFR
jgi:hypothetical protein